MAFDTESVTIYCETFLGLGFGKCEGKLVKHGGGPISFGKSGPFVTFLPPGKRKPRSLVAERSYLLVLRGTGYSDPPPPFVAQPGSEYASGLSPSGGDAVFDKVYRFNEDSLLSFDPRHEELLNIFINSYADNFLVDYRRKAPPEPIPKEQFPDPMKLSEAKEPEAESDPTEPVGAFDPGSLQDERRRVLASKLSRPGQAIFRRQIMQAYEGRCAITGCNVPEALEAAHIIPHCGPQSDHICNGLLLRLDLHALFDAHILAVEPGDLKVQLSSCLRDGYYKIVEGRKLRLPRRETWSPHSDALAQRYSDFMAMEKSRGSVP